MRYRVAVAFSLLAFAGGSLLVIINPLGHPTSNFITGSVLALIIANALYDNLIVYISPQHAKKLFCPSCNKASIFFHAKDKIESRSEERRFISGRSSMYEVKKVRRIYVCSKCDFDLAGGASEDISEINLNKSA